VENFKKIDPNSMAIKPSKLHKYTVEDLAMILCAIRMSGDHTTSINDYEDIELEKACDFFEGKNEESWKDYMILASKLLNYIAIAEMAHRTAELNSVNSNELAGDQDFFDDNFVKKFESALNAKKFLN
jgi:hypothetical protein